MSIDVGGMERKNLYMFAIQCAKESGARKILDIACGDGEEAYTIALEIPSVEVVGVDIDEGLIRDANGKFRALNLTYAAGDARRTPFRDGEFDCIISFHTVEHFSEPDQKIFLGELRRMLQPAGKLCIATPDRDVWALQGIAGMQTDHIRELNQKEFINIVSAAGFRIEYIYGQSILKKNHSRIRPILNFLKKLDVFRLRRLLGHAVVDRIDLKTQPVNANTEVVSLRNGERASVTVLVCKRM